MKKVVYAVLVILLFSIFSGCQPSSHPVDVTNAPSLPEQEKEKPFTSSFFHGNQIKKIMEDAGTFNTVAEWLDNETILYIKQHEQGSVVNAFHLFTGETYAFFQTEEQVISVTANKDFSLFAVRTSPGFAKGSLTVLNKKGKQVASWEFDGSTDLVFSWNPFTGNEIIASSFQEDWTYTTSLLETETGNMVEMEANDPFVQWLSEKEIGYLGWDERNPSLTAPLYKKTITKNEKVVIEDQMVMFQSFENMLVTLGHVNEQESMAAYTFYRLPDMVQIYTTHLPILTMYSNYHIPYNDFANGYYFMIVPSSGGSMDSFTGDFKLMSFNMEEGSSQIIKNKLENKPIRFSPNGQYCLYGYQLERLLLLSEEEQVELVKLT
ncbi:hypothetical protein FIU87_14285 [Bacillus sp. THAF10]|uniref:YqgU-like beta propeller domain-containing protein n=1 Tax=Bacillus sp. THAF10 TaxID=2587848 RepID=UPI001267BFAE|nr:hypothetical protein [Bacillus sp. THAF10]QFT89828.1 hypothetical protein FIU87_14285 [Bacillus sp. THAF10]